MLVAESIITKCSVTLKDPDYVRWGKEELLSYLDEAQKEIARNPGANVKEAVLELDEGTKQALPENCFLLASVIRNWDEDDEIPAFPVRITTRSLLDAFEPGWHMCPKRRVVENYIYDDRTPDVFFVYPPNDGTGKVDVMYSAIPATLTDVSDQLELKDEFEPALINYVLYRAYTKDSDYSAGLQLAAQFYTAYSSGLTAALQAIGVSTPNAALAKGAVKGNGGTE